MGKLWLISGTWHSDWVKAVSRVSLHFKHLLQLLKMFSSDVEPFSSKNTKGLKDAVLFKMPEVGHGLGKWGMAWGSGAWPGEVGHGLALHPLSELLPGHGEGRCQSSRSSDSAGRSALSDS